MSISGLHITMLGLLGGFAVGALWRRSERASLWLPAPVAARWGGVGVAWLQRRWKRPIVFYVSMTALITANDMRIAFFNFMARDCNRRRRRVGHTSC